MVQRLHPAWWKRTSKKDKLDITGDYRNIRIATDPAMGRFGRICSVRSRHNADTFSGASKRRVYRRIALLYFVAVCQRADPLACKTPLVHAELDEVVLAAGL